MWKQRIIALLILAAGVGLGFFIFINETKPFQFGLDLQGGVQLTYEADLSGVSEAEAEDRLNALRDVIERRVNSNEFAGVLGVLEPTIQTERVRLGQEGGGEYRVIVELPGVSDPEAAKEFIGETPLLEFKLVDPNFEPPTGELVIDENGTAVLPDVDMSEAYIETGLTGQYLKTASVQFPQQGSVGTGYMGAPFIAIAFDEQGADLFAKITREHMGESLAIFLDGQVISAPVIQQEITGGEATITGNFTIEEAKTLAGRLSQGALPVQIELVSENSIGPSLGADAMMAGVKASIIGLVAVMLFMILYYRLPGLVAGVALVLYSILMLVLFKLVPVTLTAAGLAGFVISLGISVDANVLIFERMKEELRAGRSVSDAVSNGFSRAWLSIRDGNITSVIASVVILILFKTSFIRGFAVTFTLGIIVSMLTAVTATRYLLHLVMVPQTTAFGRFIMRSGISK